MSQVGRCYLTHQGRCLDMGATPASLQLPQDAELRLHIRLRCARKHHCSPWAPAVL